MGMYITVHSMLCVCAWDVALEPVLTAHCVVRTSLQVELSPLSFVGPIPYNLVNVLSDEAVTKLYLKYRHLPSLQACIAPRETDPQHLSHEKAEKMKGWVKDHLQELMEVRESSSFLLILVEAGVADEEACSSTLHRHVLQRELCAWMSNWICDVYSV